MFLDFNDNKKNWIITESNTGYTLYANDFKSFSKTWKEVVSSCLQTSTNSQYNSLIVNDGSQLIYNSLVAAGTTTIVDPLAYEYTEAPFKDVLYTVPFKNVTDTLQKNRKLVLLDETFADAYEDCLYKNKYDLIFINVKSAEDLSLKSIERYFLLLEDFGCLFIQVGSDIDIDDISDTSLEHYFSYLSVRIRSSNTGNSQSFKVYRKIQGLI